MVETEKRSGIDSVSGGNRHREGNEAGGVGWQVLRVGG